MKAITFLIVYFLSLWCSIANTAPASTHLSSKYQFSVLSHPKLDMVGGHWETVQDQDGFIWFGGAGGLARYDGYEIKIYRNDNEDSRSLSGNYVSDLLVDSKGVLWVATRWGLNQYDRFNDNFIRHQHDPDNNNSIGHNFVWSLLEDHAGDLWLGTENGVDRYIPSENRFEHIHDVSSKAWEISGKAVWAMLQDDDNSYWFGTEKDGLRRFSRESGAYDIFRHHVDDAFSLSHQSVLALEKGAHSGVWVGTYHGLNKFDSTTKQFTRFFNQPNDPTSLSGNVVRDFSYGPDNKLWIATDGNGLNIFDEKRGSFDHYQQTKFHDPGIVNNKIRSLFHDKDGGMWLGHFPAGVSLLDSYAMAFTNYKHNPLDDNSLSNSDVLSVCEDSEDNLWVGTEAGLNYINRQTGQIKRYIHNVADENGLQANPVLSVLEDQFGKIWVGTWGGGLSRFDPATEKFTKFPELNANEARAIIEDRDGAIWVGTENGLSRYSRDEDRFKHYSNEVRNKQSILKMGVNGLHEDRAGYLWTAGDVGVTRMNRTKGTFLRFTHDRNTANTISPGYLTDVYEDAKGTIWITAGASGVNEYDPESKLFRHHGSKDGLADDVVGGLVESASGDLWFSTGSGLSRYDRSDSRYKNYTSEHGLPGNLFKRPAALQTRSGELVFGSTKGLTIFRPEQIQENSVPPPVVLTDFQIFNRPADVGVATSPLKQVITHTDRLELDHTQSVFSFKFAALNYLMPEKNTYAYRLEGFDEHWNHVDARRVATYTNLDAGTYTFRVIAANNDGVWNSEGRALRVTILAPWWRTWWAYTIFLGVIAALVLGVIHFERQKAKHARERMEQEQRVVKRLQHLDKLKDEFLANTSHELKTPLQGIIGIAESLLDGIAGATNDAMTENLGLVVASGKRLNRLVNDILDYSKLKDDVILLRDEELDLRSLVEQAIQVSTPLIDNKDLTLVNSFPEKLPKVRADGERILQVLLNLIGNAIKFTEKGCVTISAEEKKPFIEVTVSDTGIGIPDHKFEAIFGSFEQAYGADDRLYGGTGLGLSVTRRLIELHGGKIEVSSTIGEGAVFTFSLYKAEELTTLSDVTVPSSLPVEEHRENVDSPLKIDGPSDAALDSSQSSTESVITPSPKPSLPARQIDEYMECPHILVVDDEPVNRTVLRNQLSLQEYQISEASDGAQALEMLKDDDTIDLVLLDVMMPKMSGYEVLDIIRQTYGPSELPVLLLTAKNRAEDVVRGFEAGANDFIAKPITKEELLSRVATHLALLDIRRSLDRRVQKRTQKIEDQQLSLLRQHENLINAQTQLVQSEKMACLGILVAGMAHEINNPTNYVQVNAFNLGRELKRMKEFLLDLASEEADGAITNNIEKRFSRIFELLFNVQEGGGRVKALVEDLSLFSCIDDADLQVANISACLSICLSMVRVKYNQQVEFVAKIEDNIEIQCLPAQLNQAFMNLMTNGCQAIIKQKQLVHDSEPGTLEVEMRRDGDDLRIIFKDTGCGISHEVQEHIFEPFYTTRPVGEGAGLGLSIAYNVVEMHRGRIEVISGEGEGTTFNISIPM